jgi:hypothetical protein
MLANLFAVFRYVSLWGETLFVVSCNFSHCSNIRSGPDSVVGIANGYGLEGPGI